MRDESNKATLAQVVQILFLICLRCGPRGFRVHCVPGACALVAALSVAGLPCSSISVRRFLKELIKPFHIRGILIRYQRSKHVPQHDKRNMERGAWKACFVQSSKCRTTLVCLSSQNVISCSYSVTSGHLVSMDTACCMLILNLSRLFILLRGVLFGGFLPPKGEKKLSQLRSLLQQACSKVSA